MYPALKLAANCCSFKMRLFSQSRYMLSGYFSLLLFAEKVTKSRRKTNTSRFPVGFPDIAFMLL